MEYDNLGSRFGAVLVHCYSGHPAHRHCARGCPDTSPRACSVKAASCHLACECSMPGVCRAPRAKGIFGINLDRLPAAVSVCFMHVVGQP